jgi:hypothetical protein
LARVFQVLLTNGNEQPPESVALEKGGVGCIDAIHDYHFLLPNIREFGAPIQLNRAILCRFRNHQELAVISKTKGYDMWYCLSITGLGVVQLPSLSISRHEM